VRSAPFFEPDPLERVSGPSSAGNRPKPKITIISFITYSKRRSVLGWTYGRIFDSSFGGRTEHAHEIARLIIGLPIYGEGVDTETPKVGAGSLSFSGFSVFVGWFHCVSGGVSYPLGRILESAFLWRCFCRQKPPCSFRGFM
jgi:hypothetical protein